MRLIEGKVTAALGNTLFQIIHIFKVERRMPGGQQR